MSQERERKVVSGWVVLPITIALLVAGIALLIFPEASFWAGATVLGVSVQIWTGILLLVLSALSMPGFFTLQPNEARVLLLFGHYRGTTRQVGFQWGSPFYANGASQSSLSRSLRRSGRESPDGDRTLGRYKVSLRARTLPGERIKVNDQRGNPIEIAAVVVWHVADTAQAIFDVDDYRAYVAMQSETAVRHLASSYSYDQGEDATAAITLRGNVDEVSQALRGELQERLAKAGVAVDEARLTHLAYSPEIAQAMLRRQQAEAIIAARQKIVQGAVGMVDQALLQLSEKNVVELDEERKASMVSNLMVVLCGESQVTPVVNTGTLYQ
jgi:regulator of protease activity HflC (stomatin/prohibitin superfamily)